MKIYPMTLVVSDDATDITIEDLAKEANLNINSVKILLAGSTIHISDDYLDTVKEINTSYAGKITLLLSEPIDLGDDVIVDMNAL